MKRHQPEAVSYERRCVGIAVVMLMIGILGVLGCGRLQPADAQQPRPAQPARPTSPSIAAVPSPGPSPAPTVVEHPAPAVVEQPAPAVVEQPAPAVAERPAPAVAERPAPTVAERPAPTVAEQPAPAVAERPDPAVAEQPAPAVAERPARIEPDPEPVIVEEPEPVRVAEAAPEVPAIVEQAEPVALEPDEPVDYLALAEAAADAGDCQMALEHMRRVRVAEPDDLMLRLREAMMCNDCRQPRQSLKLLLDLDARTRAGELFAAEIAKAFLSINEPGKAAMTWELRYIIDPSAWNAAAQAAIAWLEAGVIRPAHWWYEQARAAAPDSPEVQMLTAVIESARANDG